jgi:hypothetical protein
MRFSARNVALFLLPLSLALRASAVEIEVTSADTPDCDTLSVPTSVDELGLASAFPAGEQINSVAASNHVTACAGFDNETVVNAIVTIVNSNTISFSSLWYVAEPETTLSNADGTVNGLPAFKIDKVGVNQPLVSESILADGIFSPGERWRFLIQDYVNGLALPSSAFSEVGIPSAIVAKTSSGSIIAIPVPVPEPGTAALVGLGLVSLAARRRVRG